MKLHHCFHLDVNPDHEPQALTRYEDQGRPLHHLNTSLLWKRCILDLGKEVEEVSTSTKMYRIIRVRCVCVKHCHLFLVASLTSTMETFTKISSSTSFPRSTTPTLFSLMDLSQLCMFYKMYKSSLLYTLLNQVPNFKAFLCGMAQLLMINAPLWLVDEWVVDSGGATLIWDYMLPVGWCLDSHSKECNFHICPKVSSWTFERCQERLRLLSSLFLHPHSPRW